jgi:hypothetical protein
MGTLDRLDLHHPIDRLAAECLAIVERSPDVLSGQPVFRGTRVPATALLDYLAAGDSLDTFLRLSVRAPRPGNRPAGAYGRRENPAQGAGSAGHLAARPS